MMSCTESYDTGSLSRNDTELVVCVVTSIRDLLTSGLDMILRSRLSLSHCRGRFWLGLRPTTLLLGVLSTGCRLSAPPIVWLRSIPPIVTLRSRGVDRFHEEGVSVVKSFGNVDHRLLTGVRVCDLRMDVILKDNFPIQL